MLRFAQMTRRFGALTAVDRLELEIGAGEIFGLVGPDGAGKTTALRVLCGLMEPSEGEVFVNGLEVGAHLDEVKDQLGYMAQRFGLYPDLTVEENLVFYGDLFGVEAATRERLMAELLDMTRMSPFRQRPAGKLSGGMKQKLALMCTLLHRPKVLVLDEPTNGVDPVSRRDFWHILYSLAQEGMTILTSTAYLDEAERCDRVGLMHGGRLIRCASPVTLKIELAGRCYAMRTGDRRGARARLLQLPGVLAAEPAGAALHVYLDGTRAAGEIDAALRPVEPALEDVYIALIREAERAA